MAIDVSVPRTRRALLAGGIGGLAALVASALGRPLPTRAGTDGDVVLGAANQSDTPTAVYWTEGDPVVASGYTAALMGDSYYGSGLLGISRYGWDPTRMSGGEAGDATDYHAGVIGVANLGDGVSGRSMQSAGVHGSSDLSVGVAGHGDTGVQGSGSVGVSGVSQSTSGIGVRGDANATTGAAHGVLGTTKSAGGVGVYGQDLSGVSGIAVKGESARGIGIFATAAAGYALRAVGRVKLDQCAGLASITAGSDRVTVTPGIDLVATSAVVATLQGNAGSPSTAVSRVTVNATANTFTIILTKAATVKVKVAWHVFG